MKFVYALVALSIVILVAACGGPGGDASAPQAQPAAASDADIGDHIVHFSAQSTNHLSPEVAQQYGIVRSNSRAMLNVSVIEKGTGTAALADVQVRAVNLAGQLKNITMRKIEIQEAIYYIGETGIANRETLVFTITVKPEGALEASEVRFTREFYTN
jgi:hypothetical protein